MTTFRLRLPKLFIFSLSLLNKPLLILLFLFFLTSSSDLLHVYLLLFKIKLTNAIAFTAFLGILLSRAFQIPKQFFFLALALLGCMLLSLWNSPNLIASIGFITFFVFNFFFYFLIPYNAFRFTNSDLLFKIYSYSFYCTGIYALCQVLFSLVGIKLPGVQQYIGSIARGAAFAYEPSFYALYMTPFAMFSTTKFILQDRLSRKIKTIFWPNFFMLISTSTGCFFSYIFFILLIFLFQKLRVIKISIRKLLIKFFATTASAFFILLAISKELVYTGLFKFFYGAKISHFSVQDRWRGIKDYWNIFLEYPICGVSFGAGPFYLAKQEGTNTIDLLDRAILNRFSPMNVTTEVLASAGILGALCFLVFFYLLIRLFRSTLRAPGLSSEERITLVSLALSICVMLMTLQFNQSIMRAYMWVHIGIFCGYANYLKVKAAQNRSQKNIEARFESKKY